MKNSTALQIVLIIGIIAGFCFSAPVWGDDDAQLRQQVAELQQKVGSLEAQLANRPGSYVPADDPFAQMMLMQQQMERNMGQTFNDQSFFSPRMDMRQTDKQYIITMDIPGMDKNKIDIQVKDGVLTISGERKTETDNNGNQYYRQERSFGTFMQAVPLPDDAKTDKINAKYENGVLTVKIDRQNKEKTTLQGQKIVIQ